LILCVGNTGGFAGGLLKKKLFLLNNMSVVGKYPVYYQYNTKNV
jgi:hypothetical protein